MSSRASMKVGAARVGALGFLAIALACAALAAFSLGNVMKGRYTGARVAPIVVARAELRAGQMVTSDQLEVRDWPAEAVPTGAYATIEELLTTHKGAAPTVGILVGEPVTASRLSNGLSGTGIAALVRGGMRATALRVDDAAGFTGLIYPGAFVDVVATVRDPNGRGPSARLAVQNARVLSVGMDTDVATRVVAHDRDSLDAAAQRGTYVTLEVTPDEAEILAVARNEGRIDLVLRNATDDQMVETAGATPERFSAFADDEAPAASTAGAGRKAARRTPRGVTVQRDHRRIQIVASDRADSAGPGGAIEVINAQ